jgi:hypothetical protein
VCEAFHAEITNAGQGDAEEFPPKDVSSRIQRRKEGVYPSVRRQLGKGEKEKKKEGVWFRPCKALLYIFSSA